MKKIVAIDFGMKRMGLAISDANQVIALPWKTVDAKLIIPALKERQEEIGTLIIGLPLLMNGTHGDMARTVETFAKKLEDTFGLPVLRIDERLSSKHADAALRETGQNRKQRKEHLDTTAATLLLQSYLIKLNIPR